MRSVRLIWAAVGLALVLPGTPVRAQDAANYPNKPVRLVLGFAAGGGTDLLTRIIGPKLSDILGQPVIVENRTGAGGRLAVEHVQSQPADGHTALIGAIGQLAVATAIYPKLSFHPTRTLMPITMLGSYPLVLSGPASGDIKTVADLVAFGKANPDKSNYPTSSPAFTIASELFKLKTGMPGQPIPYRSTNEMLLSVVGGQTLFAFPDSGVVVPMAQGGKVRALAVGRASRIPELPDVPTLAEAGRGDVDLKTQWIGAFLVAGTPAPIAKKLETALRQALADAGVRERIRGITYFPEGGTAEEFRARIDGDIQIFYRRREGGELEVRAIGSAVLGIGCRNRVVCTRPSSKWCNSCIGGAAMSFRITGLPAERFSHLFALTDTELAAQGAVRRVADRAHPRLSLPHQPDRLQAGRRAHPGQLRAPCRRLALPDALCDLCAQGRGDLRRGGRGAGAASHPHARGAGVRRGRHDGRLGGGGRARPRSRH